MTSVESPAVPEVTIVIPAYNEEENVRVVAERVSSVLNDIVESFEIIFVNDGSADQTGDILRGMADADARVRALHLSRNFGHQAALLAGLDHAEGRAVVTMDCDLQHPPELLPDLLQGWRDGFDIVYTVRERTAGAPLKELASRLFYRSFSAVSEVDLDIGAADFRLMDHQVVQQLRRLREHHSFFRGLIGWIGFESKAITYVAPERHAGRTKYTLSRMMSFAVNALFSFSLLPLRLATWLGFALATVGGVYGLFAIYSAMVDRTTIRGWASLLITSMVVGGVQLLFLGIIGEYVGRIYEEVKGRPNYIVRERNEKERNERT